MRSMSSLLPISTRRSKSHSRSALQMLSFICALVLTNGFNTCNRGSQQVRSGVLVAPKYPSRALCPTIQDFHEKSRGASVSVCLFRQRVRQEELKQHALWNVSKLQMTATHSSNDVSNHRNPFVKCILKKPFQSSVTTDTDSKGGAATSESVQEDVITAQMENLATFENETKSELSGLLGVVEDDAKTAPTELKPPNEIDESKLSQPSTTEISSRQATASSTVDLSGNWTLIVDDVFKTQYDEYLRRLGQPMLVRTVALTVIGSTREETNQMEGGQKLFIKGTNVRGSWERTLEASEPSVPTDDNKSQHEVQGHVLKPMITADDEEVEVASWWEENGTVHKSWVVGGKKYGGGDFENKRYLTDNGNILVCESIFHPKEEGREKAHVTWRFLKEGAMYGEEAAHFPNPFEVFEKKDLVESVRKHDSTSKSGIVVGDIMDSVTTSDEVDMLSSSTDIEKYIGWVPPLGERWAIAAPGVDLSGKWKLIITEQFKRDYEEFLKSLGQPLIVRGAAVVLIGNTREETKQTDGGRSLYIKGINAKGIWERTLSASGSDFDSVLLPGPDGRYNHTRVPVVTADAEEVLAESWWENDGTVHVSWTLGVKKYGGGSFESKRYLENNGDVYVCETTFHPNDVEGRDKSYLTWRFLREGATIFVGK